MKILKFFIIIGLICFCICSVHAQYRVSGYVFDGQSRESLIGANVYNVSEFKGAVSNEFGYYSLPVNNGTVKIRWSFVGYYPIEKEFEVLGDTMLSIELVPGYQLDDLIVSAAGSHIKSETGMATLTSAQMQMLPSLAGEVDVVKALHSITGISGAGEGSATLLVRGGDPDGNLILLDDIPMYYTGHLGGFTSIFDESAIKTMKIYKAGFPARYGGRLSSVLDIRTIDGNMRKREWEIQVETLVSKVSFNGPIIEDKTSFSFSYRRSNLNWLIIPATFNDYGYASYKFYDLNIKANHIFSNRSRIYFGLYNGKDAFKNVDKYDSSGDLDFRYRNESKQGLDWGSFVGSLRWNYVFRPNLFANFTMARMQYKYHKSGIIEQLDYDSKKMAQCWESEFNSGVVDYLANIDFNWDISPMVSFKFGSKTTYHHYIPSYLFNSYKIDTMVFKHEQYEKTGYPAAYENRTGVNAVNAWEHALYCEYLLNWRKLNLNAGMHYAAFITNDNAFTSVQPRVSLQYQIFNNASLKGSFARMEQFTHMLSVDGGGGLPSDVWVPVGGGILPAKSDQFSLGYFAEYRPIRLKWNIDAFYKTLDHLIDYKTGESIFTFASDWQDKTEIDGEGRIAGFELDVEKTSKKLYLRMGYTWTKNQRRFENLNSGRPYPAKYERRHDFHVLANYIFNNKVDVSATWNFASGIFQTLGTARGMGMNLHHNYSHSAKPEDVYKFLDAGYGVHDVYVYDKRNNYQYPNYHRLDLSVRFKKQKSNGVRTLTLGVINAYNRQNPYTVYYRYNNNNKELQIHQKSLFPVLPSFSWKYKWGDKI